MVLLCTAVEFPEAVPVLLRAWVALVALLCSAFPDEVVVVPRLALLTVARFVVLVAAALRSVLLFCTAVRLLPADLPVAAVLLVTVLVVLLL